MKPGRGVPPLLFLLLLPAVVHQGREVLRNEGLPAFVAESTPPLLVGLGEGFLRPGIHQFSDGTTPMAVIEMTGVDIQPGAGADQEWQAPLENGACLHMILEGNQVVGIMREWLPAGQRIALGIPLHPDRMTEADWEVLPGIGAKLAQRIEQDRQKNGDFGTFEALERVSGVGPKSLNSWRPFFQPP